jgi:TolB-like protein/Flp pilus assembly protein TadD
LTGLAGVGWWARNLPQPRATAGSTTLAVLPFRPLVNDGRDELLEVGMADSLIARLSLVPGLVVRSTGSVRRYAGVDQDPLRAARELEVAWIVDGSLQRRGEQLRATARLLHAYDGTAAWSGTFDEQFTSVFDIQDTISTRVAQVLEPRLRAGAAGRAATAEVGGTRNTDAYQLYLAAARHALLLRGDGLRKALSLYREALAIDPNYALAWVGLAVTYRRSFIAIDGVSSELFGHAGAAVDRALAIAPNLAEALVEQAYKLYWHDFDWPAAEATFRHAVASNPNVALARFGLATMLLNQDRLAEGFAQLRLARELDPMSPLINTLEANYLLEAGRVDEAGARLKRAFDIAPNFWLAHDVLGLLELKQGQTEPAFAAMRRAVDLADGSTRASAVLGGYLARNGQHGHAHEILEQLRALARSRYVPGTALATVHAALRESEPALDALDRAYRDRDVRLVFLKDDPLLADLRSEPRFIALLKKLGLDRFGRGLSPV